MGPSGVGGGGRPSGPAEAAGLAVCPSPEVCLFIFNAFYCVFKNHKVK